MLVPLQENKEHDAVPGMLEVSVVSEMFVVLSLNTCSVAQSSWRCIIILEVNG